MKKHKCDGCKYKSEYQAMGFKPNGICSREHNLIQAEKSYNAEVCPFSDVNPDEYKYLVDARIVKRCDKTFEILSTEQLGNNDKEETKE